MSLADYGANLATLYRLFSAKAKHVIWTTTTPCPNVTTSMGESCCALASRIARSSQLTCAATVVCAVGRTDAKVRAYNAAALKSLTQAATAAGKKLLIDDLYSAVDKACGANYKSCALQKPQNVHFQPKGCEYMAEHVAASIVAALNETSDADE